VAGYPSSFYETIRFPIALAGPTLDKQKSEQLQVALLSLIVGS